MGAADFVVCCAARPTKDVQGAMRLVGSSKPGAVCRRQAKPAPFRTSPAEPVRADAALRESFVECDQRWTKLHGSRRNKVQAAHLLV